MLNKLPKSLEILNIGQSFSQTFDNCNWNEIDNLKLLHSAYIVCVVQVIHTNNHLYIVTEKGGKDLFEFFDKEFPGCPIQLQHGDFYGNVLDPYNRPDHQNCIDITNILCYTVC